MIEKSTAPNYEALPRATCSAPPMIHRVVLRHVRIFEGKLLSKT